MKTKALIIEDQEGIAVAIEHQLLQIGRFQVDRCHSVAQALDRLSAARKEPYALILCDYNLGEGTNGQQLLEYLRSDRKIPRSTSFTMITAEASYGGVASAVELSPDAYLLKPFTHDGLAQRVSYALDKRQALASVYACIDRDEPEYAAAIKECNQIILAANRYALDALKLKTECLLKLQQWGEAAAVYDKIIAWRRTPWAEVGRARALRLMGEPELAEKKLQDTLKEFPQFVAVYDELGALAEDAGDPERAQRIFEAAHRIVPSNRRTRGIGLLALQNGDLEKAASFLKIVTERDRYGLKRTTEDFFGLAAAYRRMDRHDEAMAVIDTLKDHFPETRPLEVRKLAAEAMILVAANRPYDAKKRVRDALEMRDESMEARTQLELGEACCHCDEQEAAEEIFMHVCNNWQEDKKIVEQVKQVMQRAGLGEDGEKMLQNSLKELTRINNEAAAHIKQGHFDEAIAKMDKVAKRLPSHATVQSNYIHALLLWLEHEAPPELMKLPHHSKPRMYVSQAREHLRRLARINPNHPRLPALQRLFAKLTGETGATADVGDIPDEAASMEIGE